MTDLQIQNTRRAVVGATPTDYVTELILAPEHIREAERRAANADAALDRLKALLKDREDTLLLDGELEGKNADWRAARLRRLTADLRAEIVHAESLLEDRRITMRHAQNRFSALRAIVRYLAREGEEETRA